MANATLKRNISLPLLTFYGLGTILGAGIYVLIGEVAGRAGMFAPISFLLAAVIAAFTAISYAELSARIPKSAGEAVYAQKAFNRKNLSLILGLLVVFTGVMSSATLVNGFSGYFQIFFQLPSWLIIAATVFLLGALACWGIKESAGAAMVLTIIEVIGLLIIIFVASGSFLTLPEKLPELIPSFDGVSWMGIFLGSFLAFFAFIGFEDMVNVAEEVKNPRRNMPRGIFLALIAATILYILVALVAVLSLPTSELAGNSTPLATIYEKSTGKSPILISLISLFAIVNGILVQMIMGSRILYGLGQNRWLPKYLSEVNPKTRTPINATILVIIITLIMALWLPLVTLAQIASFVVLTIYAIVNLSLVRIKMKTPKPQGVKTYSMWIPVSGFLICAGVVIFKTIITLNTI
jgi:amino acid transporter